LKWLREYVDFDLAPEDLAHRLTMAGLEVSAVEKIGGDWGDTILVGHVRELEQHPNADRLKLATVDLGTETLKIVCGAPNVESGQKIVLARVGSRLTDPDSGRDMTLKAARIRGVVSEGMVCSERELGLGDDHTGIIVLPEDAPVGTLLDNYLGDVVLDIDITPNRPDWASVIGIAWEVAALSGGTVRMPHTSYEAKGSEVASTERLVQVEAPDLSLRYTASLVSGLTLGESPGWMQLRLQSAGVRAINNVVDVTNYVMLEYGQPLHSFDRAGLEGGGVIVRRARSGERLTTLDGRTHELTIDDLVIADTSGPVGLAGVMGGASSEVSTTTTEVLLESATFSYVSIRKSVQRHRIEVGGKRGTEASQRFERGLPEGLAPEALRRATGLLVEYCGGTAADGIIDVFEDPAPTTPVRLTSDRLRRVLGMDPGIEQVENALASLGFDVRSDSDGVNATPPFWRNDIAIPEDLVEEIARTIGYDKIPMTSLGGSAASALPDPVRGIKEATRDALVSLGMQETISYPLVSKELLNRSAPKGTPDPLSVWNRMSPEQEFLRTTMRGSIFQTFVNNERATRADTLRLFDIGRTYTSRPNELPVEREVVVGVLGGPREPRTWLGEGEEMDFFDAKGVVEELLARLEIPTTFEPGEDRILVPGRTAQIVATVGRDNHVIGLVGEVHPDAMEALEIRRPRVMLFEIDLTAAVQYRTERAGTYRLISRYPGVIRDLALLVDQATPSGRIERIIREFPAIAESSLVDVYTGEQVPQGKKSLAFYIVWQSPTRTLTDIEVEIAQNQLLEVLERETGATLRS